MIVTFAFVFFLQINEKNFNKKSKFDKFKIPIISSSMVGLISYYVQNPKCKNNYSQQIFTEGPNF